MSIAGTWKALSDPTRRDIIELLKSGKMSAGDISAHFN
ncbi:MAG: ArsR family transcriptional regulator, partial [Erysipelotrichaceae bacterium]